MMEWNPFMAGGMTDFSPQAKAQGAHNQLVASAKVVRSARQISKSIKVGMMLAYQPIYAYTCDPDDQLQAKLSEQTTLFYSDVQMGGFYPASRLKNTIEKESYWKILLKIMIYCVIIQLIF